MRRVLLTTAVAPALWGTTYAVTAAWLPSDRPLLAATLRALPVGVAFSLAGRALPPRAWVGRVMVLGALNFAVFFACLFTAAYRLPGGLAATLAATQPVVVTVLAGLLLTERIAARRLGAAAIGVAGVALLVLRSAVQLDAVGVVAAIGAAASMGTATVLVQRWGRPAPLLTFAGWQLAAGGFMLAPATLVLEGMPDQLTATNVAGYLYLMLPGAALAYPVWFRGIEKLGAGAATFFSLISPLVATLVGVGFRGEHMRPPQVLGALGVVTSVVLGQARTTRNTSSQKGNPPCTPPSNNPPATRGATTVTASTG